MPLTLESLRTFQWGKESTKGTAVAATSKIAVPVVEFEPLDEVERPHLAQALVVRNSGQETVVGRGTRFSVPEAPVAYDQFHAWCGMAIKDVDTPSGAPSVYTWAFPRDITTTPTFHTRTLERRLSGNAATVDQEWAYAFLTRLGLRYRPNETLKFTAEGVARRVQASTLTGAQAMPTVELAPAALGKVWIDPSWATLGTTVIAGQVLEADWSFTTGLKPKMTLDGRADLDFTIHTFDHNDVQMALTLKLLLDSAQYATEKAAAEAQTLRAVRLKILGTASREITVDGLYRHEPGSLFSVGQEEGQDIVSLSLVEATDATNFLSVTVVNAAATLV